MTEIFKQGPIELRCGKWQDALADVESCDAVITDPPYGARTHAKQFHGRRGRKSANDGLWCTSRGIGYDGYSGEDVAKITGHWSPVAAGWVCFFTSHDLIEDYRAALSGAGRYAFAPLACVIPGMNVRLAGDGPSNWAVWLCVARPKTGAIVKWGTLPGAYIASPGSGVERAKLPVVGAKPLGLMRAIIRDYTRPGDLVVDPCAGGCTTGIAAAIEGRRFLGAEMDPETFTKAVKRIKGGYTPDLFT